MIEICLRTAGLLLLLLSVLHVAFPKRFHWNEELARLSPLNRQMFLVHCLFIVLQLVFMGLLSLVFTRTLLERTALARVILAGLSLFWAARLFVQWFVYDRRLWWGYRFNTIIHFVFTALWIFLTMVYGWAFWLQVSSPS